MDHTTIVGPSEIRTRLLNNWLVVAASQQIGTRPIARTILGFPLVLFRTPQGISALSDRCPHRNAPLSGGRIIDGCVQCPYHGWRFNASGECSFRPGVPDAIEQPLTVPVYRCVEKAGLVWIKLDAQESDHQPPSCKWDSDSCLQSFLWTSKVESRFADAIENLLDGTHTPFVHAGLIRNESRRQSFSATVRIRDGMVEAEYLGEGKQAGWVSRLFERERTASFGRFVPPCIAELEYRSGNGSEFVLNSYFSPIDDRSLLVHSKIYLRRGFVPLWVKRILLTPFFRRVMYQDQEILKQQQQNIDRFAEADFRSWEGDLLRGWIDTWLRTGQLPMNAAERTIRFDL